ncbi:hypothetical protein BT96DRAFT_1009325 [Gymnopus androsaceus JB14]|uniref:Uncharacterized protein n=1 Tax=Gymnopus androsaceus JB14 TaxID=1447944 RepID=A0A6A4GCV3_9AGAR|nr:hypothetical protein BT96DRAFT_1009325 [Gymnopus androsaceus JB14]
MPTPPAFSDLRIKFLKEAAAAYNKDTSGEDWNSFVLQTTRCFIKRFPVHLGDKEDPSMEAYNAVDDSVVDLEVPMPELGTKEYDDEVVVRAKLLDNDLIHSPSFQFILLNTSSQYSILPSNPSLESFTQRLKAWLGYHFKNLKTANSVLRSGEGKVTQAVQMRARLLNGGGLTYPRKSTGPNVWARDNPEAVAKLLAQNEVDTKAKDARQLKMPKEKQGASAGSSTSLTEGSSTEIREVDDPEEDKPTKRKRNDLTVRNSVVNSGFRALPLEERNEWEQKAVHELQQAKAEYENIVKKPPSETSKDRQICIDNLPEFMQSVCEVVTQCTGWPCGMWAGGPQPAQGGRPMVTVASSGSVPGDPEMTFSKIERTAWKENVLPAIAAFLQKVFSPEDCKGWALTEEELADREDLSIENEDPDDITRCHLDILGYEAMKAPENPSTGDQTTPLVTGAANLAREKTKNDFTEGKRGQDSTQQENHTPPNLSTSKGKKSHRTASTAAAAPAAPAGSSLTLSDPTVPISTTAPSSPAQNSLAPPPSTTSARSESDTPAAEGLSDDLSPGSPPRTSKIAARVPSRARASTPIHSVFTASPPPDSMFASSPPRTSIGAPPPRIPSTGALTDDMEVDEADSTGGVGIDAREQSSKRRAESEIVQDAEKPAKRCRATTAQATEGTRATRSGRKPSVVSAPAKRSISKATTRGTKEEAQRSDTDVASGVNGAGKQELVFPSVPPGAPAYIKLALDLFITVGFNDSRWKALVTAWLGMEKKNKYKAKAGTSGISKQDRPIAVGMWIDRGRKKFDPKIDLDDHAIRFSRWWRTMQPEGRADEEGSDADEETFNIQYSQ